MSDAQWRNELLREQYAQPVREYTGTIVGPTWQHLMDERWNELNQLGDDVWLLHTEYVRKRAGGTPVEDIEQHIVHGEILYRAQTGAVAA